MIALAGKPLIPLPDDPFRAALLRSVAALLLSYLLARIVSFVAGRLLARAARRTATALDQRLVSALGVPVTYAVFLLGAMAAVALLPLGEAPASLLARAMFALFMAVATIALIRAWRVLLAWHASDTREGAEKAWARDFGPLLSKVGTVLIALFGLITVLEGFGVEVRSLVVSLGVGSLAVGLAAQDTLANMFAGFTLVMDRPFKVGDRIQLASGEVGDVVAIGMRATRLKTLDETVLVIPNSVLTKEKVINQSQPSRSLTTRIEVGVAYGTDLALARRILTEAALASERVEREPAPIVLVTRFADFAVNLRLILWVKDYTEQALASSEVHEEIYRRLKEAGIEIPYPVHRVIREAPEGRAERERP